jgi:Flp pilus assembly protein TadD
LTSDPGETRNLAEAQPDRVAEFESQLRRRLADSRPALASVGVDPAERARLRSLGYVVPTDSAPIAMRAAGPDPKDEIELLNRIARAEAMVGRGDAVGALRLLQGATGQAPGLLGVRAAIAVRAGDLDQARRDARALLENDPEREDVWIVLGKALELVGDSRGARDAFARAAALVPGLASAEAGLARTGGAPAP